MPDIIFIHCQSFSRKPNAAGQCVAQVIGEDRHPIERCLSSVASRCMTFGVC